MYSELDQKDPMVVAMCAHTDQIPRNFDQAVDAMVEHATADEDFILRHMDYERLEAILHTGDTALPFTEAPPFNLFDD